jgi:glycosyltransferase involved in cell wall biosynthesis
VTSARVSVIIPVHDRRHCVMDAVNSVLDQSHDDIECVLVDDGSTDGTYELLEAASTRFSTVRVLRIEHAGVSAARNAGLRAAEGDVVTFLDSDDMMTPDRVKRQLEVRAAQGCDGIIGRADVTAMPGASLPTWFGQRPEWANEYYWTSLLIDIRHVRDIGGFDETLEVGEDIDLLVRLRECGLRIDASEETWTLRRYFGDNLTYRIGENDSALRDAIRRHVARRRAAAKA